MKIYYIPMISEKPRSSGFWMRPITKCTCIRNRCTHISNKRGGDAWSDAVLMMRMIRCISSPGLRSPDNKRILLPEGLA